MNYVPYVTFKNRRAARIGCMKCNSFLYDFTDRKSVLDADQMRIRVPVALSDGSRTDLLLCKNCEFVDADIPALERTIKRAWLYEFIIAGRPRDMVLQLAIRTKALKILGRCDELSI